MASCRETQLSYANVQEQQDNWIAHQDEFNQLLSELNACHKQNGSRVAEDKTAFSLEEKSKSSKKRVHYQKFTKGKDLSSRSVTDLACIFGKRGKRLKRSRDQAMGNTCLVPIDDPEAPGDSEPKVKINTVTSSLSVQEYFAKRMAQLKAGHEIHQACATQDLTGDDMSSIKEAKKKRKKCGRRDASGACNFDKQPILTKQAKNEECVEINNDLIEHSPVKENCQTKKSKKNSAKYLVLFDQKMCPLGEVESEEIPVEQHRTVSESSEKQNEQVWREDKNKQKKIKKLPYASHDEISQSCHESTERRKKKKKKQKH
ncbi:PIN2/TERF1-interacting telomerase inhibitor 1 [Rhincodon typus]|uniref:PIN2/TERF1-interacting telomerase inhibitor 1 n=1 Tax=Rhincodon typus TaxID=259920 RepID=UPI0020309E0D|nr:PIN2/TERF1-interacting telomerase inhibitor 1 [Rhincodon typus]